MTAALGLATPVVESWDWLETITLHCCERCELHSLDGADTSRTLRSQFVYSQSSSPSTMSFSSRVATFLRQHKSLDDITAQACSCRPQRPKRYAAKANPSGFLIFQYYSRCDANFYHAMHFSAKRGLAIGCRLSVRPSVRLSVCDVGGLWSHRLEFLLSEIISPLVSLGCSLSADPNIRGLLQGEPPWNFGPK